jgi:hypothetical protein
MKKALFGFLLMGGFLMAETPAVQPADQAADQVAEQPAEQTVQPQNSHIGYFERIGLASQSPRVITRGKENRTKEGYRIVANKSTVVAYIPYGK